MAEEKPSFLNRNALLRCVKPYPTARNHVYTGKVIAYDGHFVTIDGIVLHFGHPTVHDPTGGLTRSPRATRWVALQGIEYIRELPKGVDPIGYGLPGQAIPATGWPGDDCYDGAV